MGSEPDLRDFLRPRVLKIGHSVEDRQELIKKKSMKLMIFFKLIQDQVFGLLQKPLWYHKQIELWTEHWLLKPDKVQVVQLLYEEDRVEMLLSSLTELKNKSSVLFIVRMRQQPFIWML